MIRPGQAIMIAWLTTAHAPLWEPTHEWAPSKKNAANLTNMANGSTDYSQPLDIKKLIDYGPLDEALKSTR